MIFSLVTGTPVTVGTITGTTTLESLSTPSFYSPVGSAELNTADLKRNCSTIAGYTYIPGNPSNAVNSSRTFDELLVQVLSKNIADFAFTHS